MQITVWEGDFGLASMDVECIKVLLYWKISQAPIKARIERNPLLTSHRRYPIYRDGRTYLTSFNEIAAHLRFRGYGIDYTLSSKQCSQSYALINLVELYMKPILSYALWVDAKNYEEVTGAWYTKAMWFPFGLVYPRLCRKQAVRLIESAYPSEADSATIRTSIASKASECFSTLANRLGNSDYFFGVAPTSVDVMVYAYLAPLAKIPMPSAEIQAALMAWPELIGFVRRIDERYFPEVTYGERYVKRRPMVKRQEEDLAASKGTLFFALVCVTFTMASYAAAKGIFIDRMPRRYFF